MTGSYALVLGTAAAFVGMAATLAFSTVSEWEAADVRRVAAREAVIVAAKAEQEARLAAAEAARRAALEVVVARAASGNYEQARWDPLHFRPAIETATDEQCLVCHAEVTKAQPLPQSPAGLKAADSLAWYQTLDTYDGEP